jgi:hypothetical protein
MHQKQPPAKVALTGFAASETENASIAITPASSSIFITRIILASFS